MPSHPGHRRSFVLAKSSMSSISVSICPFLGSQLTNQTELCCAAPSGHSNQPGIVNCLITGIGTASKPALAGRSGENSVGLHYVLDVVREDQARVVEHDGVVTDAHCLSSGLWRMALARRLRRPANTSTDKRNPTCENFLYVFKNRNYP